MLRTASQNNKIRVIILCRFSQIPNDKINSARFNSDIDTVSLQF